MPKADLIKIIGEHRMETRNIGGRQCYLCIENPVAPYIYWGLQLNSLEDVKKLKEYLDLSLEKRPYNLIAFEAKDWNSDFSPWKASAVFGKEDFSGKAPETLKWLTEICIPQVEEKEKSDKRTRFIAGYSLAGLFALWAFYKADIFKGAVSCSGSLWYPGFLSYVKEKKAPENSLVYLSLGTKEEKTKNPVMAAVGDITREIATLLEEKTEIEDTVLEWNPGGHFKEPLERMGKGIAWLLNSMEK